MSDVTIGPAVGGAETQSQRCGPGPQVWTEDCRDILDKPLVWPSDLGPPDMAPPPQVTPRVYLAGQALAGLLAKWPGDDQQLDPGRQMEDREEMTNEAVWWADAVLARLEEKP